MQLWDFSPISGIVGMTLDEELMKITMGNYSILNTTKSLPLELHRQYQLSHYSVHTIPDLHKCMDSQTNHWCLSLDCQTRFLMSVHSIIPL